MKRAGLVARFLYKPEGVTFTEALTEILETAELDIGELES